MNELNQIVSKKIKPFQSFLNRLFKPGWKRVFQGIVGLITIGFLFYAFTAFGSRNSVIRYSPSDVVYGEKVIAIHVMGGIVVSTPEGDSTSNSSKTPLIQVSENYYDFGSVSSSQVLTRTFIIANTGSSPLIIQESYTTCGCTTAEFSAKEIPPGKVALMTLQFNPAFHKMSGSTVRRGVIIYTNDPEHPTQEIWIQASVR